jgi:biopolymer transport protein ExbD
MHRLTARQKAEKELKNPPEEDPEFQIAPMIDILLVLLVFFMSISSTEVLQSNHSIILAVAADGKDASKNNPGQVTINISWVAMNDSGSIDIDDVKYADANGIIPVVSAHIKANPVARVLIRADRGTKWAYISKVMHAVASSGVANVTFAVVNKDRNGH